VCSSANSDWQGAEPPARAIAVSTPGRAKFTGLERSSAPGSQLTQIAQVSLELVTVPGGQRVVPHNVVHVVNGFVQLVFIKLAPVQFAVELGEMSLRVVEAFSFLTASPRKSFRAPKIVLHPANEIAAHIALAALAAV